MDDRATDQSLAVGALPAPVSCQPAWGHTAPFGESPTGWTGDITQDAHANAALFKRALAPAALLDRRNVQQ